MGRKTILYHHNHWGCVKASKKRKVERTGRAEEEVHLSDRLRLTDRLAVGLRAFCLRRVRVRGGFSLKGAGGVWDPAQTLISPLLPCCLGFTAVCRDRLRGSGGFTGAPRYRDGRVEDLSLWECGEGSVRGQSGSLWRLTMVWWEFCFVARLLLGVVLQGQQVRLLLLQALVETLGFALLLELPPLELLSQSVGLVQGGEKRQRPCLAQQVFTEADYDGDRRLFNLSFDS